MTSSTKPEVHNMRGGPSHGGYTILTCTENFMKFGHVSLETGVRTNTQTRLSQYFAPQSGVEGDVTVKYVVNCKTKNEPKRKGKEEYLYSAFLHQGTHKALRHGSHSFTCRQHHACLSFVAFTRCHHHTTATEAADIQLQLANLVTCR